VAAVEDALCAETTSFLWANPHKKIIVLLWTKQLFFRGPEKKIIVLSIEKRPENFFTFFFLAQERTPSGICF
jgi:hypothetical protein